MKNSFILALMLMSSILWSQTVLVEKVGKNGEEIAIPYEKYELENGLTLSHFVARKKRLTKDEWEHFQIQASRIAGYLSSYLDK